MAIDNSQNPKLNMVYKDTEGNEWYCLINPLEISPIRGLSAEKAKRFMDMKIDEGTLKALLVEHGIAVQQGDFVKAFSIIQEIKYRLDFICEEESVLDLVFIYYFLKDEDPNLPSPFHNQKKRQALLKDHQARAFFLRIGLAISRKFSGTREEDMYEYLIKTKDLAQRINDRYLSHPNPNDTTSNSTS